MKNKITFIFVLLLFMILSKFTFADDDPPLDFAEIHVYNHSITQDIRVIYIPVGAIFNGKEIPGSPDIRDYRYSPEAVNDFPNNENFLLGGEKVLPKQVGTAYSQLYLTWDLESNQPRYNNDSIFGLGRYRIEFWEIDPITLESVSLIDYVFVDYSDWDAPLPPAFTNDVNIYFYSASDIRFMWAGGNPDGIDIEDVNREILYWYQVRYLIPFTVVSKTQNKGDFKTTNERNNAYLLFPIDGANYQNLPQHLNPNLCFVNLTIDQGHTASIVSNKIFKMNNGTILTLKSNANTKLNLQSSSRLDIGYGAKCIIESQASLNINSNCTLLVYGAAEVRVKPGGLLCNYGGRILGAGRIIFEGRLRCADYQDFVIGDSTQVVLQDSACWELPSGSTVIFEGNGTNLEMKPGTQMKFGSNSRLVFRDGARIFADSSIFSSLEADSTWDGIYLDGIAYDTLKNCTFQNAVNGINITDNYDPFGSPGAVEISNCTFKNSTSSDLLNYVYVNNSYNVLIKGCNSEKTGSGGFTAGIIAEYCPTNGVVIADNNINYVTTGISLLQSSEYIGRNTITGSTNSGTGIYLDNSNGTIEYNTVNNFQKSVYGSYSSPYMLKNTLSNAYVKNIDLASNSYPVMKPVVSGSTLRWLGGNNTITGTPSNSGISFADCYPLMDSGYNRITVNGSDYMNGNFTFTYTTVNAKINYWYDNPPQSSLFDISGGNVNYTDPFDGSTLPSTDGTELNSIGWGLYDTVFTKSFGDNSTPEDLFMQAYTEEMSQNYTDAITHYKEVVSSYKTSSFAPVSLSRIFNCLEKSHASISDYQTIQTYYNSIKSNSAYPNES